MNQKNKEEVVNYTLGITGFATLIALLKSMAQSKTLTAMVLVGVIAVVTFFYSLLNSGSV
ncbi:hypothetical protein Q3O59_11920 [Alkalimonas delamerensis]|uniref:Uncharacterized protein n=1 Tax=Alkalimonas delamerensis TaxID=265981 RepID=A0ABT9GS18_9GAMM|nr:hypothetical protein [Alkalimonas delamerensis]MDP4529729.1 hypothetical protein [Alkalimonas delamerensis]